MGQLISDAEAKKQGRILKSGKTIEPAQNDLISMVESYRGLGHKKQTTILPKIKALAMRHVKSFHSDFTKEDHKEASEFYDRITARAAQVYIADRFLLEAHKIASEE